MNFKYLWPANWAISAASHDLPLVDINHALADLPQTKIAEIQNTALNRPPFSLRLFGMVHCDTFMSGDTEKRLIVQLKPLSAYFAHAFSALLLLFWMVWGTTLYNGMPKNNGTPKSDPRGFIELTAGLISIHLFFIGFFALSGYIALQWAKRALRRYR
tara:strand:+ start:67082 stop:67555 length:474 start_codon:yes stop_codon:yes gene_type:complete